MSIEDPIKSDLADLLVDPPIDPPIDEPPPADVISIPVKAKVICVLCGQNLGVGVAFVRNEDGALQHADACMVDIEMKFTVKGHIQFRLKELARTKLGTSSEALSVVLDTFLKSEGY